MRQSILVGLMLAFLTLASAHSSPQRTVRLVNKGSGTVVGVLGASREEGAPCVIWANTGDRNQHWMVTRLPEAPGTSKTTSWRAEFVNAESGKKMGQRYHWRENGAQVDVWGSAGPGVTWRVEPQSDGWCILRHEGSNKVLGVIGGSTSNGARLVIWDSDGTPNQRWKVVND